MEQRSKTTKILAVMQWPGWTGFSPLPGFRLGKSWRKPSNRNTAKSVWGIQTGPAPTPIKILVRMLTWVSALSSDAHLADHVCYLHCVFLLNFATSLSTKNQPTNKTKPILFQIAVLQGNTFFGK